MYLCDIADEDRSEPILVAAADNVLQQLGILEQLLILVPPADQLQSHRSAVEDRAMLLILLGVPFVEVARPAISWRISEVVIRRLQSLQTVRPASNRL